MWKARRRRRHGSILHWWHHPPPRNLTAITIQDYLKIKSKIHDWWYPERWKIKVEVLPLGLLSLSSILTEGSMQDNTVARLKVQKYRLPSSFSVKCNVLRESLSEDCQNIPCATLKRKGSWVISIYLWWYRYRRYKIVYWSTEIPYTSNTVIQKIVYYRG